MGRNGPPEVEPQRVPRDDLLGYDRTNAKENQKFKMQRIMRPNNMCHYNHLYKLYTLHK